MKLEEFLSNFTFPEAELEQGDYEVLLDADTPYTVTAVKFDHANKQVIIESEPN